jgi:hypothetical protein
VKGFFDGVVEAVAPIFGPWRCDYLDKSNPAGLSPMERTRIDCDLLG